MQAPNLEPDSDELYEFEQPESHIQLTPPPSTTAAVQWKYPSEVTQAAMMARAQTELMVRQAITARQQKNRSFQAMTHFFFVSVIALAAVWAFKHQDLVAAQIKTLRSLLNL